MGNRNRKKGYQSWWDTVVELRAYSNLTLTQIAKAVDRAPRTIDRFVASPYYRKTISRIQRQRKKALEKTGITDEQRWKRLIEYSIVHLERVLRPGSRTDSILKQRAAEIVLKGRGILAGYAKVEIQNEKLAEWKKSYDKLAKEIAERNVSKQK